MENNIFGQRLENIMEENNVKQSEMCEKLFVSSGTMSNYITGKRMPRIETLLEISKLFNVSLDYLFGLTNCRDIFQVHEPILEVPVLKAFKAKDNILDEKNIERYLTIPKDRFEHAKNLFAVKVNDDVMRPRLYEGDIVIVDRAAPVKNADLGVFCIGNSEACIREFIKTTDGFVLNSHNPLKKPIFYSFDEIQQLPIIAIGKVVEVITFMK